MERLDSVVEALHLWQLDSTVSGHLSLEEISLLAEDGALASAGKDQMEHLSRCPLCMEEWSHWRQANSMTQVQFVSEQSLGGYGFLQAASSGGNKPFKLMSSCRRYTVEVLPQENEPHRAMMIFEVSGASDSLENKIATLRDRSGEVFLQGDLHGGQFARMVDGWDRFDLRKWTIFFREQ
ncbi:MAG: hypothetical protein U9R29_06745 [Thermodesulfobacteriota bacterium]|nr:hypothetical protein [Thermodesulfobacteriota bacterium]